MLKDLFQDIQKNIIQSDNSQPSTQNDRITTTSDHRVTADGNTRIIAG